jgi:hypothetical protein
VNEHCAIVASNPEGRRMVMERDGKLYSDLSGEEIKEAGAEVRIEAEGDTYALDVTSDEADLLLLERLPPAALMELLTYS